MTRDELIELLRATLGSEEQADAVLLALDKAGLSICRLVKTENGDIETTIIVPSRIDEEPEDGAH